MAACQVAKVTSRKSHLEGASVPSATKADLRAKTFALHNHDSPSL
ncbi:hypothetical protein OROMI_010920 [Orobanche minor]